MSRYQIIGRIGSGGMAEVHLAHASSEGGLSRFCAIKKIRHDVADDDLQSMFSDEMRIAQTLSHANIVRVMDLTTIDGDPALVMEYVHGITLSRLNASFAEIGTKVPLNLILFIGAEVAKGLHYIHNAVDPVSGSPLNIIHRDVSASNILISVDGEVKVADFGIAKGKMSQHETRTGIVKGKYAYMSPEQILGMQLDARTDVYSLGVVLWELITRRPMFEAANDADLATLVAKGNPYRSIRDVSPGLDPHFAALIDKSVCSARDGRYKTAAEFAEALLKYLYTKSESFSAANLGGIVKRLAHVELERTASAMRAHSGGPKTNFFGPQDEAPLPRSMATGGSHGNLPQQQHVVPISRSSVAVSLVGSSGNAAAKSENGAIKIQVQISDKADPVPSNFEKGVDLTYAGGATSLNRQISQSRPRLDKGIVAVGTNRRNSPGYESGSRRRSPRPKKGMSLFGLAVALAFSGLAIWLVWGYRAVLLAKLKL